MFWRKRKSAPLPEPLRAGESIYRWGDDEIPRYPPFMKGLPVVSPDKLLETQKELLDRISNSAIATPEIFQKHYLSAIKRFASFSHLLPASQSHHHRGAGGLLRHAIEVGLWALQSADRVLLKSAISPKHRREMEPRWQLAVFLAALCHDAGKPVTDLTVTNKDRTSTWHPITDDLHVWATRNGINAYFLEWREGRGRQHTALSSLIAERIIGVESLAWIAEGETELVVWLMESLACNPGPTNLIYDLVIKADQTSVERDLKTLGVAMAGYDLGVPVERHLIDIMRRFVREGMWLVNQPGARLWNIEGHVYLVWPAAGEELARQIKEDGMPGMPRTPEGILDMLTDRGMALVRMDARSEDRYWKIAPAVLAEKIPDIRLTAIRLRDEAMVSSVPLSSAAGCIINAETDASSLPASTVAEGQHTGVEIQSDTSSSGFTESATTSRDSDPPQKSSRPVSASKPPPVITRNQEARPEPGPGTEQMEAIKLDGAIGEALKALAQDIKARDKKWGIDAIPDQDGHVYLRWPDAFAGYGLTPKTVLDQLADRGWLVIDPMSPLKRTIPKEFGDGAHNAIRLGLEISKVFILASGMSDGGEVSHAPEIQSHPQTTPPAGPVTARKSPDIQKAEAKQRVKPSPALAPSTEGADHPERARKVQPVSDTTKSAQAAPTIEALLAVLRSLDSAPQQDGFCQITKMEAMRAFKRQGLKVNHRLLWKFDELKSGLLELKEDKIKFKP
ncbi:MAG: MobH family relaxase [Pseudomonadota bacterium]